MIPFVNLSSQRNAYREELEIATQRVYDSGCFIGGKEIEALDQEGFVTPEDFETSIDLPLIDEKEEPIVDDFETDDEFDDSEIDDAEFDGTDLEEEAI